MSVLPCPTQCATTPCPQKVLYPPLGSLVTLRVVFSGMLGKTRLHVRGTSCALALDANAIANATTTPVRFTDSSPVAAACWRPSYSEWELPVFQSMDQWPWFRQIHWRHAEPSCCS